jgi:hypothetical protein
MSFHNNHEDTKCQLPALSFRLTFLASLPALDLQLHADELAVVLKDDSCIFKGGG